MAKNKVEIAGIDTSKLKTLERNELINLLNLYHNTKENAIREAAYKGEQQIIPVGVFNVEKKKDAGEDADPTLDADINRSWGVLAVYDGMGGAGARKYTHKDTQEEHTSAYWASRYVKGAIEELIKLRPIGVNPVEYLESNMHVAIKQCLDKEISNFPSASSSAVSKLLAKLPTTMALCVYEIVDENLNVSCYWAGDSRVYMFDGEKLTGVDTCGYFHAPTMECLHNTDCVDMAVKNLFTIYAKYGYGEDLDTDMDVKSFLEMVKANYSSSDGKGRPYIKQ
mgnify:CR=1 FL=1